MGRLALFPEWFAKGRIYCFNWLDGPKRFFVLKVLFFPSMSSS